MFTKGTKFFADYRDEHGVRHRKSFETAAAAKRFEVKMKREVAENPQKASASRQRSGRSSARSGKSSRIAPPPQMHSLQPAKARAPKGFSPDTLLARKRGGRTSRPIPKKATPSS